MITTTVIWSNETTNTQQHTARLPVLESKIDAIAPDYPGVFTTTDSGTELIVVRSWPTVAVAQEWVDYITTNYDVISAVVDPAD